MICPNCNKEISEGVKFCPNCGKEIIFSSTPLSSSKKVKIYLASFFLSPLGLYWFFKYFRNEELGNRKVAYLALVVTLLPLIASLVVGGRYITAITNSMDTYKYNLDAYTELGF